MGWLFCKPNREELVKHLLTNHGERIDLVDHSRNGNHLWCLYRAKTTGKKFIVMFLMQGSPGNTDHGDDYRWGYKDMDETMGPCYYTCPKRLLDQSDCDAPEAVAWRQRCYEHHETERKRKRYVKGLKPGDTFMYNGQEVLFVRPMARRGYVHGRVPYGDFAYRKSRITPVGGF